MITQKIIMTILGLSPAILIGCKFYLDFLLRPPQKKKTPIVELPAIEALSEVPIRKKFSVMDFIEVESPVECD